MSRWQTLPNELDPEIKEFVSQLRWLVDLGGLGGAALADRTGYGRASWESYLAGRLLAPKGAAVALAEAAGTSPVPIITMWELAERAWSRAELGHEHAVPGRRTASGTEGGAPGVPRIPAQPTAAAAERGGGTEERGSAEGTGGAGGAADSSGGNSWGLAGYQGPSRASGRPGAWPEPVRIPDEPEPQSPGSLQGPETLQGPQGSAAVRPPAPATAATAAVAAPASPPAPDAEPGYRQPVLMFLGGFGTVLLIILGVFYLTGGHGGGRHEAAPEKPARSASPRASLPPGVRCSGADCVGKDAESMGCSGDQVTTAQTVTLGTTTLEVRYSKVCGTAWGRITGAVPGDKVQVTEARGKVRESGEATQAGDAIAYTPMIAVPDPARATACATLASGRTGCTR
ncbi:DUF2690 domain-containing protein [Streptomyces sp. SID685]|uniref:DUF2690 domain-containing protein n=1 Tax=Streptomyces sp. SID685 TaxID=2690322 RepID=UPI001368A181|nr:DUF2690 domain-containing protein [Streptomyces sp. SID685]MYR87176.1 DUF2690 domain-containing protein [Streptomyces sp. SID685]